MNERTKIKIAEKIKLIETGKFLVDDIELLLIYIRDWIGGYPLFKELCHFIAHPTRDKGLVYDEMDIFYSKFKYMPKLSGDSLDYSNVSKEVFELLFIKGIDQQSDAFWTQKVNKDRLQLKSHIKSALFTKTGAVFKVVAGRTDEVRELLKLSVAQPPAEERLTQKTIIDQVKHALNVVCHDNSIQFNDAIIDKYQDQIMLNFFNIIQDCNFLLHDGMIAKGFISIDSNNNLYHQKPDIGHMHFEFSACVPIEQSFALFPIIRSNALVKNHLPHPEEVVQEWNDKKTWARLKLFSLSRPSK